MELERLNRQAKDYIVLGMGSLRKIPESFWQEVDDVMQDFTIWELPIAYRSPLAVYKIFRSVEEETEFINHYQKTYYDV
jgi:hypothetical protein